MSHECKQRLFYETLFMIQNFSYRSKNGKIPWVASLLSSEMHYLSMGQGLTLLHKKKTSGVPLNILSSVLFWFETYNIIT